MKENLSRVLNRRILLFEAGLSLGGLAAAAAGVEMMKVSDPKTRNMSFRGAAKYIFSEGDNMPEMAEEKVGPEQDRTIFDRGYVKYPTYLTGEFLTVAGWFSVTSSVFNAVMIGLELMGVDTTNSDPTAGGSSI